MPAAVRYGVLATGVVAVGWAAIFFRLADEAPALTVAAYRLAIASLILAAVFAVQVWRGRDRLPHRRHWRIVLVSGIFLGLHFWAWFASLERTSVASSVVIVTMQPLLGALLAFLLFRERPTSGEYAGLVLASAGLVIIAGGDLADEGVKLEGDLLALLGAVLAAAYLTAGRHMRADTSALSYSVSVYSVASLVLALLLLIVRPDLGPFSAETWTWIVLLAVVTQVVGHTALNWALGHFRVVTVGLAILGEPVVSTLLAIPILDERPPLTALLGGVFILAGVVIGLSSSAPAPPPATVQPK